MALLHHACVTKIHFELYIYIKKKKSKIHANVLQGTLTVDPPTIHNLSVPPIKKNKNSNKKPCKMIKGKGTLKSLKLTLY